MAKIKEVFKQPNMAAGYLYFYVHFITEIVCFYCLAKVWQDSVILWMIPFIYDALAFVPQSLIGYFSDKFPKINVGLIGIILLSLGLITFSLNLLPGNYTELVLLCLGNACLHVAGAEVTLRSSAGKISSSAIFVSGGSFGVILGKLIGQTNCSCWFIAFLALSMIPFVLLAEYYRKEIKDEEKACAKFNYHNSKISPGLLILLVVLIVIIRGYVGYGIPTSWNKTIGQNILFYFTMGLGKALGGIFTDAYGIRRTSLISILGSLPFLLFGDKVMFISLIGIMLFSMTMAITLALLVSVLKKTPGLAFGYTTIGLFLGTVPIFFFRITNFGLNAFIIIMLTIICFLISLVVIRKKEDKDA